MQIDWLTVSAQIVNFLILVWLLKHFLYQPVINAMDRREQRIAERLGDAERREQSAEREARAHREKSEALTRERGQLMAQAREEVVEKRKALLEEVRNEVDEKRRRWEQQVARERAEFLENLKAEAGRCIQAIARRALRDLADTELEERIIDSFVRRLENMDDETRWALAQGTGAIFITTSFELAPPVRARLTRAVHEHLVADVEVSYRESEELLCGIELSAGGRKLAWTLAGYLASLHERMEAALGRPGAGGR
ncbi:MAG: F0F1 ATP synthase subunit B [Gammaproteobacteria bacterium]|nr:F0F1 ATP synthase subunit B [Gammaproteobacteria bacterium]NIR83988.1 F0F1 ATP synthase subunit B [Gammaproteobacteria bacterium]NIR89132.1 F0F1 ATP synthase subunit B [Gammaproteobacteria bacterium]NIU04934.1 F0F1 ATP synthase subunit B [Gammaproteobacteria bacterium]NIV52100.1 F0F1 ATP synthase subunit B [Gammaproteobacteria bacterium]